MVYICNAQCDYQNSDGYVIVTAVMHPLFKVWSAADHTRHLILAPKGCEDIC
jgi:hypothetical protein